MKNLIYLFLLLVLAGCSTSRGFYTYRVASLPDADEGTIYIDATGLSGSEQDADNNAAYNAFNAILFNGVPNSVQKQPLVDDEAKAKSEHADIINCFRTFECYSRFIITTEKVGLPQKLSNGIAVDVKFKINLTELRKYLEQNHVIRKFGF